MRASATQHIPPTQASSSYTTQTSSSHTTTHNLQHHTTTTPHHDSQHQAPPNTYAPSTSQQEHGAHSHSRSLEQHHATARRLLLQVHRNLEQLETGQDVSIANQANISKDLNHLNREVATLDELLSNQPGARRTVWRRKLTELRLDADAQRAALARHTTAERSRQLEVEVRSNLLAGRSATGSCTINIDESIAVSSAHSQIDHLTGNAMAALAALGEQRSALKGIERKVLDVASKLGISTSVLRAIERRTLGDKLLVYGGMVGTLFLLWLVFKRRAATPG